MKKFGILFAVLALTSATVDAAPVTFDLNCLLAADYACSQVATQGTITLTDNGDWVNITVDALGTFWDYVDKVWLNFNGTPAAGYQFQLDGGSATYSPNLIGPFVGGRLDITINPNGTADPSTRTLKLQKNQSPDQNLDPDMFNALDQYGLFAAGVVVHRVSGGTDLTEEYAARTFGPTEPDPPVPVPEPASMLLLGSGLIGLTGAARRRLRK